MNTLSERYDVLFVIAAGNAGPKARTIGSPGSAEAALTVGAVDRQERIASFSSVGPTVDGLAKPDITAPGVGIVAARAAEGVIGTPAADGYTALSGTSMATPHVAGAAAILAQVHPGWRGQQIKQALTASAVAADGLTPFQQGSGRVDVARALTQTVTSTPAVLDFGEQRWPHNDDEPIVNKLTYHNAGKDPVTIRLTVDSTAPAGMFTVSASSITVPAGGSVAVDVTADARAGTADGAFAGTVVAAFGDQTVRNRVALAREVKSYDLMIKTVDNRGAPAEARTVLVGLNHGAFQSLATEAGAGIVKVRLPKDDYAVNSTIDTPVAGGVDTAMIVQPLLPLTKTSQVSYDGRTARPVNITPPQAATISQAFLSFSADRLRLGGSSLGDSTSLPSFKGITVGRGLPADQFNANVGGVWDRGDTRYNLVYGRAKSFYTGYTHRATKAELALVGAALGLSIKTVKGDLAAGWAGPGGGGLAPPAAVDLPATPRRYVTTPPGVRWDFDFNQYDAEGQLAAVQVSDARTFRAGRRYDIAFNVGVFGPSVGLSRGQFPAVRTGGGFLSLCIPLFTDGAGNRGESTGFNASTVITVDGTPLEFPRPLQVPCKAIQDLPARSAAYRISSVIARDAVVATVSTRIEATWTFRSQEPAEGVTVDLPISSVRFTPPLAPDSTASAGASLIVPLVIDGAAAGNRLRALSVEVSYDGGASWVRTPVQDRHGKKSVRLRHPRTAKSVSLRTRLTDRQGGTFAVTIIDAYRLKKAR